VSKAGLPVINIPGCPAHPDWISQILVALATGRAGDLALDEFQRPRRSSSRSPRPAAHACSSTTYKQSTPEFGEGMRTGCLFYEFGCRGPMTHSPCNRILWNRQSSKTRAGHAVHRLHRAGVPVRRPRPGHRVQDPEGGRCDPQGRPEGTDHLSYMAPPGRPARSRPQWSKEDMFVV
jgi:hypothetical protein